MSALPADFPGSGSSDPARNIVNLACAVDRLYETGWEAGMSIDQDLLPDGRRFPSVIGVQREFARAGLELSIRHNVIFDCYRATWSPVGAPSDQRSGTVIGNCEREAAVYALAQICAPRF